MNDTQTQSEEQKGTEAIAERIEQVLMYGDLSPLTAEERVLYYNNVCASVGLNPLTRPFEFIKLNGKTVLYARREATEQLRTKHTISISLSDGYKVGDDVFMIRATATDENGRNDEASGGVSVTYPDKIRKWDGTYVDHPKAGQPLTGDDLANAMMKAESKAKRRVTLSICGLGLLDETEVQSVKLLEASSEAIKGSKTKSKADMADKRKKSKLVKKKNEPIKPTLENLEKSLKGAATAELVDRLYKAWADRFAEENGDDPDIRDEAVKAVNSRKAEIERGTLV